MPRFINEDTPAVYRVRIDRMVDGESIGYGYHGPYDTLAAASREAGRMNKFDKRFGNFSASVEFARTEWEAMP